MRQLGKHMTCSPTKSNKPSMRFHISLQMSWRSLRNDIFLLGYCLNPRLFYDPTKPALSPDQFLEAFDTISRFDKYGLNKSDVLTQWGLYITKEGLFGHASLLRSDETTMVSWWTAISGMGNMALASIAIRLLSIPTSSAASERNFSANGYIHNTLSQLISY
jgi:hAT family C-terminal dimerisation region